ncbi:FtsX-like permease family protein [Uliginosibacterium sp. H3]|uniref:FtsX-like permease family protein n=1 Tax=Uliginosibacterium silvisoli TaxID=3114758 RepID=A0ABU6K729_9RHOO|nr:FtsX-like permease family protein [Uliginosibacterium sp. H3]
MVLANLRQDSVLALRNLWRSPTRSGLALLTIVGGIVAYVLAAGFIDWVLLSMRDYQIYAQLGHFQISHEGYAEKGGADPYRFLIPPNNQALDALLKRPEIVAVAPRLALSGLVSLGDKTIGFLAEGVDPVREEPISRRMDIRSGENLRTADQKAVLLGEGLAAALEAKVGDHVILLTKTIKGSQNAVEFVVAGTFSTSVKAYDDAFLRLPINSARQLVRTESATTYIGVLRDTDATDEVVAALRPPLKVMGLSISAWHERADFYHKTVALFSKQVGVIRFIIALIIVLSVTNTLSMSVAERTSEIGTSLAIGSRRSDVLRMFLTEGVVLGIVGGILGLSLGALLATLISSIGIPMPAPPGMAHGYVGEIRFSWPVAIDAFVLAGITTLAASVLPAWRASRMNIVDALRQGR